MVYIDNLGKDGNKGVKLRSCEGSKKNFGVETRVLAAMCSNLVSLFFIYRTFQTFAILGDVSDDAE